MVKRTICDGLRTPFWCAASARLLTLVIAGCGICLPAVQAADFERSAQPAALAVAAGGFGLLDREAPAEINETPALPREAETDRDERDELTPETGIASWYGSKFHRRKTASGELFDMFAMTAAHRTLAFGTMICVRSQITGRGVVVRVNDRGPHARGRVVDLSRAAAIALGVHGLGLKPVEVVPLSDGESACPQE